MDNILNLEQAIINGLIVIDKLKIDSLRSLAVEALYTPHTIERKLYLKKSIKELSGNKLKGIFFGDNYIFGYTADLLKRNYFVLVDLPRIFRKESPLIQKFEL